MKSCRSCRTSHPGLHPGGITTGLLQPRTRSSVGHVPSEACADGDDAEGAIFIIIFWGIQVHTMCGGAREPSWSWSGDGPGDPAAPG